MATALPALMVQKKKGKGIKKESRRYVVFFLKKKGAGRPRGGHRPPDSHGSERNEK